MTGTSAGDCSPFTVYRSRTMGIEMRRVGLVGWRGMVGSVLLQRMQQERDFDHVDPVFFTTSQVGDEGPAVGKKVSALKDARDLAELKGMEIIISCQGGDYTNEIFQIGRASCRERV